MEIIANFISREVSEIFKITGVSVLPVNSLDRYVKSSPQFNQGEKVFMETLGTILLPRELWSPLIGGNILAMLYVRVSSCFSAKQPTPS